MMADRPDDSESPLNEPTQFVQGDSPTQELLASPLQTGETTVPEFESPEPELRRVRTPEVELGAVMRALDAISTEARQIVADLPEWKNVHLKSPYAWRALYEATYSEGFAERLAPKSLENLRRLYIQWKTRFGELRFLTSTRPVWNS